MSYRFFAIPAFNPASAEAELNQLLAARRVLNVERHFVADGGASFWAICVSLAPGPGALPDGLKADQGSARRIDYREVLNEADFAAFAELRSLRKTIPSIRHQPLLDLLGRRFKGDAFLRLLARIVACGATSGAGVGLPIGALTAQHFANAFLDSACGRQRAPVRGIVRSRDVGHCKEKPPASRAAARGTTRPGGFAPLTATRGTATTATTTRAFAFP